ncbi:hypothetical protein [Phenylobacterium sp.]|uniref:hypothetical protein n=1 Tax=Phenylobacterium sp. TaxID=1871053 RepID=UPI00272F1587|nr:hypothetical protein [Phenylobacterium sp.]MDP1599834.1 hypothetical protein [Phenylobacterium sp.]MDP3592799.1 hypothetical protein [Phenylobacterium sp.]
MSLPSSQAVDNRRAVLRVTTLEILKALRSLAQLHDGDLFALLVFTSIWSANGEHLIGDERYSGLRDIGPDSTSKPVTDDQLQRSLGVPRDMLDRYVEMFIHMGLVERISGGLVVPGAVFTSAEMMSGANEAYDRIVGLISALRGVGFSLGENIS